MTGLSFRSSLFFIFFSLCWGEYCLSQRPYSLTGKIFEVSGQSLPGANIIINEGSAGTSSDNNGEFRIKLEIGLYKLSVSHIGYESYSGEFKISGDTSIRIELKPVEKVLNEVLVKDKHSEKRELLKTSQSAEVRMTRKELEMIPTIAGENDIIRLVQLMPGVSKGIEGSGDFFVRGGDADQNLLLLDGATIYNTGHLFGFISVFNPDVIEEATILRGAFPASYGGRLSSILDIRTRPVIQDKFEAEGAIGLISSRVTLRAPLKKNKSGFMISGRRTYVDQVVKMSGAGFEIPYYFYDLNGRFDWLIDERTKFYFSGYYGADILNMSTQVELMEEEAHFESDNILHSRAITAGIERQIEEGRKMVFEIHNSAYKYDLRNTLSEEKIKAVSGINDIGAKMSFINTKHKGVEIWNGFSLTSHNVEPIVMETDGIISNVIPSSRNGGKLLVEGGIYFEFSTDITERLRFTAGARESFGVVDQHVYPNFEPRVSMRYTLNEISSLKASYSRMAQYLHRVSSSAISLPVDFWYTSTRDIKPQNADQYTIGWACMVPSGHYTIEADIYYKEMHNLTEYAEGTTLLFNADFEKALLQGSGQSYGFELMVKKNGQKLHGWLSYSLGWSYRQFDELNEGRTYHATYDRRHNGAIVLQYNILKRFAISAVWEYISGKRFTPVIGQYAAANTLNTGIEVFQIYSERNAYPLADAHRLDLMVILKGRNKKRLQGELRAGLYNVYNRATPIQMYVTTDDFGNYHYIQPGLFGSLPFVSYHFKF